MGVCSACLERKVYSDGGPVVLAKEAVDVPGDWRKLRVCVCPTVAGLCQTFCHGPLDEGRLSASQLSDDQDLEEQFRPQGRPLPPSPPPLLDRRRRRDRDGAVLRHSRRSLHGDPTGRRARKVSYFPAVSSASESGRKYAKSNSESRGN